MSGNAWGGAGAGGKGKAGAAPVVAQAERQPVGQGQGQGEGNVNGFNAGEVKEYLKKSELTCPCYGEGSRWANVRRVGYTEAIAGMIRFALSQAEHHCS